MALELKQQLKLSQQLLMTPQLQQAIKLLQLSRLELVDTVQHELMENPFLEEGEDSPLESRGGVDAVAGAESSERHEEHDAYDKDIAGSADWEDYLGDLSSAPKLASSREYELSEEISSLEARHAAKPTLESHLMWQLRLSSLSDEQKEIGELVIGNLDRVALVSFIDRILIYDDFRVEIVFKYRQEMEKVARLFDVANEKNAEPVYTMVDGLPVIELKEAV